MANQNQPWGWALKAEDGSYWRGTHLGGPATMEIYWTKEAAQEAQQAAREGYGVETALEPQH